MFCPECEIENVGSVCTRCGKDIELLNICRKMAMRLYNAGLKQVGNDELSAAIDTLERAVDFDSSNTDAYNLLALCYYRVGHVGKAVSALRLSLSGNRLNNPAKKLLASIVNDKDTEKLAEAITLYNQSLKYTRSTSMDMAIIRLKRAADLSPHFVDALNLLALCYLNNQEPAKAAATAERALAVDRANVLALKYLYESQSLKPELKKTRDNTKHMDSIKRPDFGGRNLHIAEIVCLILGALISLIVLYNVMIPDVIKTKDAEIGELTSANQAVVNRMESELEDKNATITDLNNQIQTLKDDNADLQKHVRIQELVQKVQTAASLQTQGKLEDAVFIIESVDAASLPDDALVLYNTIATTAYPALQKTYFDKGYGLYNQRNYAEAKIALELCLRYDYGSEPTVYIGDSHYFLGRICEVDLNKDAAREHYQLIIDRYENSRQLANAKMRLKNLG